MKLSKQNNQSDPNESNINSGNSVSSDNVHEKEPADLFVWSVAGYLDKIATALQKKVYPLGTLFVYVAAIFAFTMAVLILVDVFFRAAYDSPFAGVVELETIMLGIVMFFSLAYAMIKHRHIAVDIFTDKFPKKLKIFLDCIFSIFGIFLFTIISIEFIHQVQEALKISEKTGMMLLPFWIFYALSAIGCILMVLVLLVQFLKNEVMLLKTLARPWIGTLLVMVIAAGVLTFPLLLTTFAIDIDSVMFGMIMIGVMMFLLFIGLPVAFTMGLVGILGTWYLAGLETSLGIVRITTYEAVADYFLCTIPFFVLMGFICLNAGVSNALYNTAYKWLGKQPGGMAIATVFGCGGFASICGDSLATAATMGSVSLPEMKKYKYDDALATGSVAAGGTLGILIPPSIGFIFYGLITEESVGKLFAAGVIPGIILVLGFALMIYIRCRINPSLGPVGPTTPLAEKMRSLLDVWPIIFLFVLVIGGIYVGLFTPTESGGIGVMGALAIALTSKGFSWKKFVDALISTLLITGMVAGIMIGVTILGYFITLTDIPNELAGFISSLEVSRYVLFVMILLLYLVLGMMMNIIPMIMLTLPIIFPTIIALGFDPIWFGVIMVIMMEMGQISPPVGINVFVISGVAKDVPISKIFKGVWPFLVVEVIVIILLTIFPEIVMFLPDSMDVLPDIGN